MNVVSTKPAKPTKQKKYMYVCKTCQKDPKGFNYSSTTFIANYPEDFHTGLTALEYCFCPNCNMVHYASLRARLRYLFYEFKKHQQNG